MILLRKDLSMTSNSVNLPNQHAVHSYEEPQPGDWSRNKARTKHLECLYLKAYMPVQKQRLKVLFALEGMH